MVFDCRWYHEYTIYQRIINKEIRLLLPSLDALFRTEVKDPVNLISNFSLYIYTYNVLIQNFLIVRYFENTPLVVCWQSEIILPFTSSGYCSLAVRSISVRHSHTAQTFKNLVIVSHLSYLTLITGSPQGFLGSRQINFGIPQIWPMHVSAVLCLSIVPVECYFYMHGRTNVISSVIIGKNIIKYVVFNKVFIRDLFTVPHTGFFFFGGSSHPFPTCVRHRGVIKWQNVEGSLVINW